MRVPTMLGFFFVLWFLCSYGSFVQVCSLLPFARSLISDICIAGSPACAFGDFFFFALYGYLALHSCESRPFSASRDRLPTIIHLSVSLFIYDFRLYPYPTTPCNLNASILGLLFSMALVYHHTSSLFVRNQSAVFDV
ncbi:hypothetical protein BOTBODRAFT_241048 [Botryobasidium botryosum FD-172 SS1]|uniref:Uncharacterized protein n=1 Tax=Botryobasidium botryosum (strain FD-172 SS1) TaxID=930990 RepID=A0A067MZ99_BOTB1|nr:hypothetical protein BOTBODRAFT_241048 [Botryobasidium botryosum FD-172 SS1]